MSDTKRRLAIGFVEKEKLKERVDVALATNMISVGLDITRLGLMVVLGQPKAAAEYIQATSRVGRDRDKPGLVVTLMNVHRPRDRSHYERFEAFHASFYRAVEATSVTPFAPRALDRALPALVVALSRHRRPSLAPASGALNIVAERGSLDDVAEVMAKRAREHRKLTVEEESRINSYLLSRTKDLLDSWVNVARGQQDVAARLVYQRFERAQGKALLRMPLEAPDPDLGKDGAKFKAPRSLRDVEPSVNLFVKRLDNSEVAPPDDEDAL